MVGGGFALREGGKVVAGGGGKCGEGREGVILAPRQWRGPITCRKVTLRVVEAEEP